MEVRPGIHRIPGLRWSNAYLLVEEAGLTLIDAGVPGDGRKILAYIRHIGRDHRELRRVLLTHGHPDHTGPLKSLCRLTGAEIAAHRGDTRLLARTGNRWLHYPAQPLCFGWNVPFLHHIRCHQTMENGQVFPVLGGLQVLHTPGHTPGSVCFYLPRQGVLFTGDTLLADGYHFRRPLAFPGTNLQDYRASVEQLAQLQFETACVGHGSPVLQNGAGRLQEMLEHYNWMSPRWGQLKQWSRALFRRWRPASSG